MDDELWTEVNRLQNRLNEIRLLLLARHEAREHERRVLEKKALVESQE